VLLLIALALFGLMLLQTKASAWGVLFLAVSGYGFWVLIREDEKKIRWEQAQEIERQRAARAAQERARREKDEKEAEQARFEVEALKAIVAYDALRTALIKEAGRVLAFQKRFDADAFATRVGNLSVIEYSKLYFLCRRIAPKDEGIVRNFIHYKVDLSGPGTRRSLPMTVIPPTRAWHEYQAALKRREEEERVRNIERRTQDDCGEDATVVYVMFAGEAVKVGITSSPNNRLKQVQTGNHNQVVYFSQFWFFSEYDASRVESAVHDELTSHGCHLNGEWFSVMPESARETVLSIAEALTRQGAIRGAHRSPQPVT
jgi:hypothetical protein